MMNTNPWLKVHQWDAQKMRGYAAAETFFERISRGSYPIILKLAFILVAVKFQGARLRLLKAENLRLDRQILILKPREPRS